MGRLGNRWNFGVTGGGLRSMLWKGEIIIPSSSKSMIDIYESFVTTELWGRLV